MEIPADIPSIPSRATLNRRSMCMIPGESTVALDTWGVAGLFSGDKAIRPIATDHSDENRWQLALDELHQMAKQHDRLARIFNGFSPDVHTDLATLPDLGGWKLPRFRVAHSGAVIEEDDHQAALAARRRASRKVIKETVAINGPRSLPPSSAPTAFFCYVPPQTRSRSVPPIPYRPTRHRYQPSPTPFPNHPRRLSLHNPGQPLSSYPVPPASSPNSSRQPLSPNLVSSISLSTPDGREWIPTPINSDFQLPPPVTANFDTPRSKEWTRVEQSVVPPLIAWIGGLVAVSSRQPGAVLLFVCAGAVVLATYFVSPPGNNEETRIVSAFLRRLHDILIAIGCSLIVLGIGLAFPKEIALIPLFGFIFLAGLAALFRMVFAPWITATLFGAALLSLMPFVVLAFMA